MCDTREKPEGRQWEALASGEVAVVVKPGYPMSLGCLIFKMGTIHLEKVLRFR